MADNIKCALEAILFASGEPLLRERLAQALDIRESALEKALHELEDEYEYGERGVRLLRLGAYVQMSSNERYAHYVKSALDNFRETQLSPAALEVLAIAAYNQPVTKGYIEQVRGVDSSSVVNTLCEKGLLEEQGRLDVPGRPRLYGTSPDFLRCFGLENIEDLPAVEEQQAVEQLGF